MIGLDTNVLVRYIVADDVAQSAAAAEIFESLSSESPGFVPLAVLAELIGVVQFSYDFNRQEIATVIEKLLESSELLLEKSDTVDQALRQFRASRSDFADCLIERCAHAAGCRHTVTFDKRAADLAGMHLIP